MNSILDFLDKYKYGFLAAIATYIIIFMYLQLEYYTPYYGPPESFDEETYVDIPEEDIHLKPENIDMSGQFNPSNVKNAARDINDERERSETDYGSRSAEDVDKSLEELEKQYFEESGGEQERERIKQTLQTNQTNTSENKTNQTNEQQSSSKAAAGEVMVDWSLSDRKPHQNNEWYVRNPGYKCGFASGKVAVIIKVDQAGNVVNATVDSKSSYNTTPCMIEEAKKYALKSRFNYSSSAPRTQQGYIYYTFVAQ